MCPPSRLLRLIGRDVNGRVRGTAARSSACRRRVVSKLLWLAARACLLCPRQCMSLASTGSVVIVHPLFLALQHQAPAAATPLTAAATPLTAAATPLATPQALATTPSAAAQPPAAAQTQALSPTPLPSPATQALAATATPAAPPPAAA